MSAYTIVIIVALAVFGALAARLGDYLGYRIGRKRLSLFRLRPRTTGVVVGMVIGALVPLVTAGVAVLAHQTVRDAFFRLDKIREETRRAQDQREEALQAKQGALRAAEQARAERDEAREERDQAKAQSSQLTERVGILNQRLATVKQGLAALQGRHRTLQVSSKELAGQLKELEGNIKQAERKLRAAEKKALDAETNADQALDEEDKAEAELEQARKEIEAAEEQLEALRKQTDELAELAGELAELASATEEIYAPGEELIRRRVRTNIAPARVEDELYQLLRTASEEASKNGAGAAEKADQFVEVWDPLRTADGGIRYPPEEEVVSRVAEFLTRADVETHIVAVIARLRAFPDQPVRVDFRAWPNRKVFSAGDVIASAPVDGTLPLEEVGAEIWVLLRRDARLEAEEAGILPQPGEDGGHLSFSIKEVFRAAAAVKQINGPARVDVAVSQDAYVEGPLVVDLHVQPAEESEQ